MHTNSFSISHFTLPLPNPTATRFNLSRRSHLKSNGLITFPSLISSPENADVAEVRSSGLNLSRRSHSKFDGLILFPSLTASPGNDDVVVVKASVSGRFGAADDNSGFNIGRRSLSKLPENDEVTAWESIGAADDGVSKAEGFRKTVELGVLFGAWFVFNIYFNIYNKQALKVFPYPLTVSTIQFAVGSVLVLFMWMFNLYKKPKVSSAQLLAILPLAVVHTLGNLFTNMSLGQVSVSFTHTIKAMEPFFSVIFSVMFLGERPTTWAVLSLLPIVGGVALASLTEASFNWYGFWSAMASNATNQSRNVLSKKLMGKEEESIDNITLFSIITIMSFLLLAPASVIMEGVKFTPAYFEAAGINVQQIYARSLLAALCYHAYQQVAYMILEKVSPVTHSVGNCVKRVVVIVSSVIFFRTPVSPINALGTGIGLAGVFLYSRATRSKAKPKAS